MLSMPGINIGTNFFFEIRPSLEHYGPTQVKCRLLISSIFDAMNFHHFLEMLKIMLQHFRKMLEILASKMLEIKSRHLT